MSEERSGASILVESLVRQGVEYVFGYPGGAVLPIYDALFADTRIRHILVRHEAGAAHAAEGYARSTGKPGVVLVTSGPGATNAVTGIADAFMDSIPLVVITGQVATGLIGSDAFQEADTVGITRHCTKHNYLVKDPTDLAATIDEAFQIATQGRPGPVVIDIPKDVQVAVASYSDGAPQRQNRYTPTLRGTDKDIARAIELLANARAPIFYTGGGVINSGPRAAELLRELQARTGAPVTSTLMGLGAFPADHADWLGMLGMHGTYEANMAMNKADLMVCVGARFDDRVTGRLDAFAPNSTKIHIDIDRASFNKTVPVDLPILGDCATVLEQLLAAWGDRKGQDLTEWKARINGWRARQSLAYPANKQAIMPQLAIEQPIPAFSTTETISGSCNARSRRTSSSTLISRTSRLPRPPSDWSRRSCTSDRRSTMRSAMQEATGGRIPASISLVRTLASGETEAQPARASAARALATLP